MKGHIFFDFDDTLSDFQVFVPQYVSALANLLAREIGGGSGEWANAVSASVGESVNRYLRRFQGNPLAGYNAWLHEERVRVVADVFRLVGKEAPGPESAGDLAIMLQERALRGCSAIFEGADSAIRRLSDSGFTLYIASSQESTYLRAALTGAPCALHFQRFFGPDLIDCAKEGPEFYTRMFKACGIDPGEAIVVDDQMICLEWADLVGARIVQARVRENPEALGCELNFDRWQELPTVVENLAAGNLTDESETVCAKPIN